LLITKVLSVFQTLCRQDDGVPKDGFQSLQT
jgi:hypothetical protein